MSRYSSQLQEEQRATDRAYQRLDTLRSQTRARLDTVRAAGSHGSPTQRTERDSFATMYEDRLTQLRAVEDRLVFGRLDASTGTSRYIGRIGLSTDEHEPILTDWRADAARPFYEATPSNHGDIVMRRHITLNFRTVVGLEDEVLDLKAPQVSKASQSGTLTGEGALLASLSSKRTGKMTDIVATIQAEQDRIIRAPMGRAVVVQGGPGTGKTAVALHRAAYLLYTHRSALERSGVLVVGPSSTFLHYIDQVLPSLGETGVVSRTIADLIPGIVVERHDGPKAAQLKGDHRMARAVENAIKARIRIPAKLPTVHINGIAVPVLATDIREAQDDARRSRQPHNEARKTFIRTMMHLLTERYGEQLDYTPEQSELSQATSMLRMNDDIKRTLNLAWLPMNAIWLISRMWADTQRLARYAPWLSADELETLHRDADSPMTTSDVPLLDEAMELLGDDPKLSAASAARQEQQRNDEQFAKDTLAQNGIGTGLVTSQMLLDQMQSDDPELLSQRAASDRAWTYGHVVVDEAQELTAMDWRMLIRRCPSRSFTIVGDVAQTSSLGGSRSWERTMDRLFGNDGWDLNELTINYRNPREVSDLASSFAQSEGLYISTVNAVRELPQSVRHLHVDDIEGLLTTTCDEVASMASEYLSQDGSGRIAVITDSELLPRLQSALQPFLKERLGEHEYTRLASQNRWNRQINLCDALEVKGMEYDAVVLVQPGSISTNAASRLVAASDLYVAMTRPTQSLVIIRTRDDADDLPLYSE
ncbi:HelD family protein [Bifidobacterium crudilactis]|jgi:DNA helicase IV|uniref:HelD family protein n=1 Tax=Bifidobacterium crudilactis TaxID=327277 RepID=UPI002352C625|nr:AAA family ATPase [Bifidobacterium crudilactis]MCI1217506.1 AAA family ATPase [Bifidobacterium crudilactis]